MRKALIILLLPFILRAQIPEITNSTVVGGVTENSARVWVRLSIPGKVNVEFSESGSFNEGINGTEIETTENSNLAGIVNVQGLKPATKYYYRILFNDTVIPDKERYFKTFPPEGSAVQFSFGFGSCQQSGTFLPSDTQSGNIFREIIKHNLDLFLQIGDWTYPDTTDQLPLNNDFYPADYGRVQRNYQSKFNKLYPMDTLLSTIPVDYIYDDHDYMNNNSSALTSSFGYIDNNSNVIFSEIAVPPGARENSIKGYIENFPSYEPANESRGIYHKFSYGNAEFFVLDLRSQRSSSLKSLVKNTTTAKWEFAPEEGHSILGRESSPGDGQDQLSWFLNGLKNSKAKWKFIVSSVAFNKAQQAIIEAGILLQDQVFSIPGYPISVKGIAAAVEVADKWAGFPEDLDSVLSFIDKNKLKNIVVLSGDTHTSAMDDGANAGLPELMAANLDITNSRTVAGLAELGIKIWNRGGQGLTTDEFNNAFGKVTIFGNDSINLGLIDEFGETFASYTIADSTNTSVDKPQQPRNYNAVTNYPNPFNPSTTILVTLGNESHIRLRVHDMLGREIAEIADGTKGAGVHELTFDAGGFSSGIYFCTLEVRNDKESELLYTRTLKLILMK